MLIEALVCSFYFWFCCSLPSRRKVFSSASYRSGPWKSVYSSLWLTKFVNLKEGLRKVSALLMVLLVKWK